MDLLRESQLALIVSPLNSSCRELIPELRRLIMWLTLPGKARLSGEQENDRVSPVFSLFFVAYLIHHRLLGLAYFNLI